MKTIIDLSLTIDNAMPGVQITPQRHLDPDGWNATTLQLYSHCGTHMDAPRHFFESGATIDQVALGTCIGPARVVDLTPIEPHGLITVDSLGAARDQIEANDRVLLRTDWYRCYGTDDYRNALPRVSMELAEWLVNRGISLLGVEPPSVADVNNIDELQQVHRTLLGGDVVIVEGLAGLDQLRHKVVEFVVLPLKVGAGDGAPVRAIAVEDANDEPT